MSDEASRIPPKTPSETAPENSPNVVMHTWFHLFRTAQIHAIDNQALQRPIAAMVEMTNTLLPREGRISFQAKDQSLFVNGAKLRLSTEEYELAHDIFGFFEERGISGFILEGPKNTESVRALLSALVYGSERKFEKLDAAIKAANLPLRLHKRVMAEKKKADDAPERRAYTFLVYSKLVVLYGALAAEEKLPAAHRSFLTKKVARTVQALVDICIEDHRTFLGISAVKNEAAYSAHHAANVAVLSIALGARLGLSKVDLADLGLGAVFHDVGLRNCPAEVLIKAEPLEPEERQVVEQHPLRSVEYLLAQKTFSRSVLSQMVVAFEHHRNYDGSGYPYGSRKPDIFSRIVTIADVYDALTTQRPWRNAFVPDEALGMMLRDAGKRFDPALIKVFINTLGLYPVGTLVRLDSGDLGVVVHGGGDGERLSRPIISLLGRDGKPAGLVDLAERTPNGTYRWTIVTTENPAKFGLQTSGFVAATPGAID
jgi:HD-GYP domain-containing protein (c-di-GMP phosphodiesterase class II)